MTAAPEERRPTLRPAAAKTAPREAITPEVLDRLAKVVTECSAASVAATSELLAGARELTATAQDYRRLSGLADDWEAEAGEDLTGQSGLARRVALQACARQLRQALAMGGER